MQNPSSSTGESRDTARVREILASAKQLAVEYYRLTGKPLGVTGEVAEYVAAETLGLRLAPPRTAGYDALRCSERIQIKGRAHGKKTDSGQKMGKIKTDGPCDTVLLVLLDNATLDPRQMWEASFEAVLDRLAVPGSKARARGVLSVPEFKRLGRQIWPVGSNNTEILARAETRGGTRRAKRN
jgi:hypothetical protein